MLFIFVLVFAKDSYWLNYRAYFKNQPISVSTLSRIPKSVFVFFVTPVDGSDGSDYRSDASDGPCGRRGGRRGRLEDACLGGRMGKTF